MLRDEMEWVEKVVTDAVGGLRGEIDLLKNDVKKLKSNIESLSKKPEPKSEPAPVKYKADTSK